MKSIEIAGVKNKFVSVNYLNCPGFTDALEELDALSEGMRAYPVHMIQWRNLNFDPKQYLKIMPAVSTPGPPMGMHRIISRIRESFPDVKHGYFNPPKEKFRI